MPTVFLSSTSKDLVQCREAAYRAIEGLSGYHCVRMEDFGSWVDTPDDLCKAKVAECDLFICVAGPSYGSRSPAGPSYTEREFEAALQHKKPCLVFVTSEDYPLASNLIEPDEDRRCQAEFRQRVSKGRAITRFASPEQVSVKVVQAIRNWEASQAGGANLTQAALLASQIKVLSYRVAVMNRSSLADDEIQKAVNALQTQLHRDFAPAWGIDAELTLVSKGSEPEPKSWWLVIQDEPDYAEAVGYHTVTAEGLPLVSISVLNAKRVGFEWTLAASHEILEMLANPSLNLTVFSSKDGKKGRLYVREICDPVAKLDYKIDGVVVSNFVYPAWFESFRKRDSATFDYCGQVSAPFERAPSGYSTVVDVLSSSGWHSILEHEKKSRKKVSR